MSEMRAALYVYKPTEVIMRPKGRIDIYRMRTDYTAELLTVVSEEQKVALDEGVYGFPYDEDHGLEAGPEVTVVTDVQRKKPWPSPPPPPPPYVMRRDWKEHVAVFMAPLGDELDITDITDATGTTAAAPEPDATAEGERASG